MRRNSSRMPQFITHDGNMLNIRTRPVSVAVHVAISCDCVCGRACACARCSALRHFAAVMITASPGDSSSISRFVSGSLLSAAQHISKSIHHPRVLLLPAAGRAVVFYTEINLCTSFVVLLILFLISCSWFCVWQPQAKSILFFLWHFILILLLQRARNLRVIEQTIISLPGLHSFSTLFIA